MPPRKRPSSDRPGSRARLPRFVRVFLFLGVLVGAGLTFYAACIEPFEVGVTRWTVRTEKWPYAEPLTIALVSDTHAIWPWMTPARLDALVRDVNALEPDLILLLGDYVATHPFGMQLKPEAGIAPYKKLFAPCGVFAVLGNHDMYTSTQGWPAALRATRIPVLENEALPISCLGRNMWVAGLGDLWSDKADMAGTMAQVVGKDPVILMMHNPDSFPETPPRVALSVAGHTHGGQIALPGIGPVRQVIRSRYGLRYVYGHIVEEGKDLIVTRGLGTTGLPLRFGLPPEIALVTVTYKPTNTP